MSAPVAHCRRRQRLVVVFLAAPHKQHAALRQLGILLEALFGKIRRALPQPAITESAAASTED
jgi:hypothetical protein